MQQRGALEKLENHSQRFGNKQMVYMARQMRASVKEDPPCRGHDFWVGHTDSAETELFKQVLETAAEDRMEEMDDTDTDDMDDTTTEWRLFLARHEMRQMYFDNDDDEDQEEDEESDGEQEPDEMLLEP